jgi:hypothetical protein
MLVYGLRLKNRTGRRPAASAKPSKQTAGRTKPHACPPQGLVSIKHLLQSTRQIAWIDGFQIGCKTESTRKSMKPTAKPGCTMESAFNAHGRPCVPVWNVASLYENAGSITYDVMFPFDSASLPTGKTILSVGNIISLVCKCLESIRKTSLQVCFARECVGNEVLQVCKLSESTGSWSLQVSKMVLLDGKMAFPSVSQYI